MITLLTEKQIARELSVSLSKLRQDRMKGIGLPYVKMSNKKSSGVRYNLDDIYEYLKEHTHPKRWLKNYSGNAYPIFGKWFTALKMI